MSILKFAKKAADRSDKDAKDKKAKKSVVSKKAKVVTKKTSRTQGINLDLQPLITEKGVQLQEDGYVVFRVPSNTTKGQVKQAVQERYKVKALLVRSLRVAPKKRRRGATVGKTAGWKKMYVKVDDVHKIVTGP